MGLETIAIAASIGSAVMGGIGAIQQGNAASAASAYNAQMAANNAKIATQNAAFTAAEGEANSAQEQAKTRATVAATLANQGASGVDVNTGSAVDVRASESKLGMLNAMTIRSNAARQAYGYQTEAASDRAQSNVYKSQAKNDKTAGYLNAGATVLGGLGQASMYQKWLGSTGPTAGLTGDSTSSIYDMTVNA